MNHAPIKLIGGAIAAGGILVAQGCAMPTDEVRSLEGASGEGCSDPYWYDQCVQGGPEGDGTLSWGSWATPDVCWDNYCGGGDGGDDDHDDDGDDNNDDNVDGCEDPYWYNQCVQGGKDGSWGSWATPEVCWDNYCGDGGGGNDCTSVKRVFQTAQNINNGGEQWRDLSEGQQSNGQGTHVVFNAPNGCNEQSCLNTERSHVLWVRNAGLDLPDHAEVTALSARWWAKRNGGSVRLEEFSFTGPGGFVSNSIGSRNLDLESDYKPIDYGNDQTTWGFGSDLTQSTVEHPDFGVRIQVSGRPAGQHQPTVPYVDAVEVTVYYCR